MVCHIGLLKRIMSDFMGCLGFGTRYNDDEEPIYDADIDSLGSDDQVIHGEKIDMRIVNNKRWAPTCETNLNVKVELMGSARRREDDRQHGVDIVVILDIRPNLDIRTWQQLQEIMYFLVGQLSPMDRLSVVIESLYNADKLCRLRLMNEGGKRDILKLVNIHLAIGTDSEGNIVACLTKALQVIQGRSFSKGRKPAIILLSTLDATDDALQLPLGDVPLHVLALFGDWDPHVVLKEIVNKTNGGTFAFLSAQDTKYMGKLRLAIAPCLAQLFTIAVQDLKLSFATLEEIKSITEIVAGQRYIHTKSNVTGSITLSLGNLYCQEKREFCVELGLSECDEDELIDNKASAEVLQIAYFYSDGVTAYNASPATVIVTRSAAPSDSSLVEDDEDRHGASHLVCSIRVFPQVGKPLLVPFSEQL